MNFYRKIEGFLDTESGKINWIMFPYLMKLCVKIPDQIGQTFNFPPVYPDSTKEELEPKVAEFLKKKGII